MSATTVVRYVRPLADVRDVLMEKARAGMNPFEVIDVREAEQVLAGLVSLDPDEWATTFIAAAEPHVAAGEAAETAGDEVAARSEFRVAHNWYRIGRYPMPSSEAKRRAYRLGQDVYLRAARWFEPALERVVIPFDARAGEAEAVIGYLRRPDGVERPGIVIAWGGIDTYKEEVRADQWLAQGLAWLAIDMPGVGDAPLTGSTDAERLWDAVLDWIEGADRLDANRVGLSGKSTGGYWATKVAHTHSERVRAAVNHGGPAHFAFQPEWIEKSQHGEYPLELGETLARVFGMSGFDEWVARAPELSLLDLGVLDQPCAPLLCVNGIGDTTFPVTDHWLLAQHGSPKAMRIFPSGHMGYSPDTERIITSWLATQLGAPGAER